MKKVTAIKKETDIEMLVRLVVKGFDDLRKGQAKLEQGQEEIKQEVSSLKQEQKEINRQLSFAQKKQEGTLLSLDETVHKNEFKRLVRRVEILERVKN